MASGKEIKARIKSVTNTKKITGAMELISTVKMKKAETEPSPMMKAVEKEEARKAASAAAEAAAPAPQAAEEAPAEAQA